jgi:hypothetical protein
MSFAMLSYLPFHMLYHEAVSDEIVMHPRLVRVLERSRVKHRATEAFTVRHHCNTRHSSVLTSSSDPKRPKIWAKVTQSGPKEIESCAVRIIDIGKELLTREKEH